MYEVQRLDNLVFEFLRYARPHAPDPSPTSLDDVVERVAALLRMKADHADVRLSVDRREALPAVTLDALQIEQVLFNVILNAIQASPPGSEVRIYERLEHEQAIVEVVDKGVGIPPDQMAQIIAPFFTTKDTGTGLGLPIAQRIVLAHRGRIDLQSTPGRGTRVRIRLPIRAAASATRLNATC